VVWLSGKGIILNKIENKIRNIGFELPALSAPVASYIPAIISDKLVFTSGQLPLIKGKLETCGVLEKEVDIELAKTLAKLCVLNGLAAIKNLIGDLDRITRIIKVVGYVASTNTFFRQPEVVNGASDFILEVFGENGRHVRTSVGVISLPLNSPVEIEMIVEIN
jgi:enamine deaminase RidA (YjgF/YER057c/UK114 family)